MKIKESLKNTKEKISKGYGKYGRKILLIGAGLGLTYIGYKTGKNRTMDRINKGTEALHKDGFLQFNDPITGREGISLWEMEEASKNMYE